MGSEIHAQLESVSKAFATEDEMTVWSRNAITYKTAMTMYGQALMKPMIQLFFSQLPAASHSGPESGIPKALPKVKFAPLEPV